MGDRTRILTPRGFFDVEGVELFRPDTILNEDWESSNVLASHAIPDSDNALDHSYKEQEVLTLEGVVSDIDDCNGNNIIAARAGRLRIEEACRILEQLKDDAVFLTIRTTFKTHTNMVIESIRAGNSRDNRCQFSFVIVLKKFKKTNSQNVQIQLPPALRPPVNRGDVATVPVEGDELVRVKELCPTRRYSEGADAYFPVPQAEQAACRERLAQRIDLASEELDECIDDEIEGQGGYEFNTPPSVFGVEKCYEDEWDAIGGQGSFGGPQ